MTVVLPGANLNKVGLDNFDEPAMNWPVLLLGVRRPYAQSRHHFCLLLAHGRAGNP